MRERKKSGAYEYPLAINKFFISYTIGEYVIVKPAYASKLPAALVITLNWIYKSSCRHATPAGSSYPSSVLFSLLHTWYWNPTESRFLGSRLPRLSLNIRINLLFSGQDREFSFHDTILSLSLYTFFLLILSFCVFFFSSSSSSTSSSPTDRCERNYITSPWNFFFNYPYFFESRISERFSFFNDVYHYRCFFWWKEERKLLKVTGVFHDLLF